MSRFTVYGHPVSPFLRGVCMALIEKGIGYEIQPFGDFRGEQHLSRHPFARIPSIEHDGFALYETQAILRYIDARFPGVPLQPTDAQSIARMSQVMGINDCYLFPMVTRTIVFNRIIGPVAFGLTPDEALIAAAVPMARLCIGELNRLLGDQPFLAGEELSLADLLLAPQLYLLAATPEGSEVIAGTELQRWLRGMCALKCMRATPVPTEFSLPVNPILRAA